MRFGYRRLTAMLLREGMPANHKRVHRLYREEGLAMRIRQGRRIRWNGVVASPAATRLNERWSMDFVSDCVSTGKAIRMLTLVDDCTRECPAIEVDTSLGGLRVRRVLEVCPTCLLDRWVHNAKAPMLHSVRVQVKVFVESILENHCPRKTEKERISPR